MKKHLLTLMLLCIAATTGYGQFYKAFLPSPQFTKALETIVLDFRFDFRNIQGELVDSLGQVHTYASAMKLPDTDDCKILRFHSTVDTTSCWQAIIYSGDNYKEAVKAYENTVRLVKKSQMHWIDRSPMKFTGELVKAREDMRFTTSILALVMDDPRYRDFRAEIELINTQIDQWEVQLNLSKKTDVVPNLN
jgi:hypothetical protein